MGQVAFDTQEFVETLERAGTQAPTHPNQRYRIDNASRLLIKLGLNPLQAFTRNLNAWDDAEEAGSSVLEYQEDQKAAEDAIRVFDELLRGMHG